eukprot:gnl/Spiro4/27160_TR13504_c0_g1_i1.p1 gnl/Spiro4/27160_TR13504_c0_g1~~gnl/Spiro4/27160_TR13504_c0_g1_i1.p1  ORF type:complete len:216 (-),score=50.05 gnl/Spiro4/27160_TR13504_c0_g1_i1:104-751(-)
MMEQATLDAVKGSAVSTGTSIMAVEFDGGVVVGADSRTSTGIYVANRFSDKLTPLSDRIYCCRSGSAADTQAISDYVRYYLQSHSIELGEPPQVKTAARLAQSLCYNNKDALLAGLIVAGWDQTNGGQVFSISLGGSMVRQKFAIGGSGSTYIYGYVDSAYQPNMTQQQCEKFVADSLSLAMSRDGSSGGIIRMCVIDAAGVRRSLIEGQNLPYS